MSLAIDRSAAAGPMAAHAEARADPVAAPSTAYVGLVTRTIAFGIDVALIDFVALAAAAVAALTFQALSLPDELRTIAVAAGGVLYALWAAGYWIVFWSTTGQTPGCRVMRIRVRTASGVRMKPRRALLRVVGLTLAAIPLFAGFLLILVDDRRRGLHDRIARTVVVEADAAKTADAR